MHIPDGYLGPATYTSLWGAMLPVWTIASRRVSERFNAKRVPLLAVGAAFSFIVMMFNVPAPGGTTGHAVGATLVCILLGPSAAVLTISMALAVQAFLFGDGGLTALGANCFNMAFVMPLVGYAVYSLLATSGERREFRNVGATKTTGIPECQQVDPGFDEAPSHRRTGFPAALVAPRHGSPVVRNSVAAAIAGYLSLNAAALCTAVELGLQPFLAHSPNGTPLYCPYGLRVTLPAMLLPHLFVFGAVEAAVTGLALRYVERMDPTLLSETAVPRMNVWWISLGVLVCLTPLGLLAKGTAWGEWASGEFAAMTGFVPQGMNRLESLWHATLAGYSVDGRHVIAGYWLSAFLGVALLAALLMVGGRWLARSRTTLRKSFFEKTLDGIHHLLTSLFVLEQTARRRGLLQRIDPRVKLVTLTATIVASTFLHSLASLAALYGVSVALAVRRAFH